MNLPTVAHLIEKDQRHLWHPYSSSPAPIDPYIVSSAAGTIISLATGEQLIDAMSSWWAVAHGHNHPRLVSAATTQISRMSHVMFGGLSHEPAIDCAASLVKLLSRSCPLKDPGLEKVFFCDSGSVAVEVAMKMALQYQRGKNHPERHRFLTWRRGYHGDTFAAMSVCDPDNGMHSMWKRIIAEHIFAPPPPPRGSDSQEIAEYLDKLESLLDNSVAGIIIEPRVQGAGGMRFHDDEVVHGVRKICDRHELVMIADEIATGFGRTGTLFATLSAGIVPDIICLGKALTGGFMSLAATITTSAIAQVISSPQGGGALMHGPTFMANPLACAVAKEAIHMIAESSWTEAVQRIEHQLQIQLQPLERYDIVADIRVLGAIGVVELKAPVDMAEATAIAVSHGVWLRPFGTLVYTMPPYIATEAEIAKITSAIDALVYNENQRYRKTYLTKK
ncbi:MULTISPECIES: adenosylmethionine--8-amino-7-oxononanoate transaminase [unclassified Corynebacterium]|uniref:adenosylmethionine--8-amino-7-oxononanoate transaminase n=1 Tax=unclassified Corynebacterium TaxID=2624378 RepID=UPI002167BBEC|nr:MULTISPECIES: adenosylmethionine--8-amino-7-oxononanoate transaminase [unclassified Corynebacterium]MCS4489403.1 adenosylmethionine--8-amino-7-oxononanoate transaminase [Corynebacterium sp. ES2775-CONJ]MCS4491214.1 adenosylmethionine--8-amino-7-oxononanoate transaminase [Corynebacterium sp. ES2715-CONJ3]MCS4530905.1 adenosylmethionine--8-amino-7-oxononanoate transaminase [Corynebacterium sp. ES2730-CONJ]